MALETISTAERFPGLALRERLVIAAERDIALHSVPGSRIQRVVKDAGSSNISAIRYHYGDMEKLQDAVFHYRYKAINQYADIIMQRWSTGEHRQISLQHYVFAIFAPRCLVIHHTLPAAYYCGCAEQMDILSPNRVGDQDRYLWFTPLRNCFSDLFVCLTESLDADTALYRLQLISPLTAGILSAQEKQLRETCLADPNALLDAPQQLADFLCELIQSLSASLLREHYSPVDTDFRAVFNDLLAVAPEWFLDRA